MSNSGWSWTWGCRLGAAMAEWLKECRREFGSDCGTDSGELGSLKTGAEVRKVQ